MYFGANYTGAVKNWAGALSNGSVIYLNEDFKIGRDDYMLAYELTHFMQFESGKKFACVGAMEREAYHVQDIYVAATGIGKFSDPMTVMVVSQCGYQ